MIVSRNKIFREILRLEKEKLEIFSEILDPDMKDNPNQEFLKGYVRGIDQAICSLFVIGVARKRAKRAYKAFKASKWSGIE
jgi:hypothetical protein